jgi:hypothetical protein
MTTQTKVIRDLLSKEEIASIGQAYFSSPVIVPSRNQVQVFREIVYFSLGKYSELWNCPAIDYVDSQPYDTAEEMRDSLRNSKRLLISTQYNEPTKLMSKETNLLFRAMHDLHHCSTENCNFELWGELCAFSKVAFDAIEVTSKAQLGASVYTSFLACEIIGQLCALRLTGSFPEQRLSHCVPSGIIERILHVYR